MPSRLFDLTGRTALVTGSSRGLGRAMAQGLAEAGATVVLNGSDAGRLADAASAMCAAGIPSTRAASMLPTRTRSKPHSPGSTKPELRSTSS